MKKQAIISIIALTVVATGIVSFMPVQSDENVTRVYSSIVSWTDEELIQNSPFIVKGEIIESKTSLEDSDEIPLVFTTWDVKVSESLKGNINPNSIIQIKSVGGQFDDHMTGYANYADHQKSDILVLFLDIETDPESFQGTDAYHLVTANYGVFELINGLAMNDDPTKTTLEQTLKDRIKSVG